MVREELSRTSRQTPQKLGERRVSGLVIVISTVLVINLVAVGMLIYLSLQEQASYEEQGKRITVIEQELKELGKSAPAQTTTQQTEVTGRSINPPAKTAESGAALNTEEPTTPSREQSETASGQVTRKVHVVADGDTLSVIATTEEISVEKLKSLNNLSDDILQVGQELILE